MTYSVIYHDFQQTNDPAPNRESSTVLTAGLLTKGRRWCKFCAGVSKATETTCLVVCGASIVFSLLILCQLLH